MAIDEGALEVSERLVEEGFDNPTFPLTSERLPGVSWSKLNPGEHIKDRGYGIAIRTGAGLCVIDVDKKPGRVDGYESLRELEHRLGALPATYSVLSPGGAGLHLFFRVEGTVKSTVAIAPSIDIRGEKGIIRLGSNVQDDSPVAFLPPEWVRFLDRGEALEAPTPRTAKDHPELAVAVDAVGPEELAAKLAETCKLYRSESFSAWRLILKGERFIKVLGGEHGPDFERAKNGIDVFIRDMMFALAMAPGQWYRVSADSMLALCRPSWTILISDDHYAGNKTYSIDDFKRKWDSACAEAARQKAPSEGYSDFEMDSPEGDPQWRKDLERSSEGGPAKETLYNLLIAFERAPGLAEKLAYDLRAKRIVVRGELPWSRVRGSDWTEHDSNECARWLTTVARMSFKNTGVIRAAVEHEAKRHAFDPFEEYLKALTWDGVPRLETWLVDYAGAADTSYVRAVSKRWLISAVARARGHSKADCMLILEGPQGGGKSSLLRDLVGSRFYLGTLPRIGDKDGAMALQGPVVVEIAELAAIRGRRAEEIKSWISQEVDSFRAPYARDVESHPRRCVFAGTTNVNDYLNDWTGARRFWPVAVGAVDLKGFAAARDQLWAEAFALHSKGEQWWLTPAEQALAEPETEARQEGHVWTEILGDWLEDAIRSPEGFVKGIAIGPAQVDAEGRVVALTTAQILAILEIPHERGNTAAQGLPGALGALGWVRDRWRENGSPMRGYRLKAR